MQGFLASHADDTYETMTKKGNSKYFCHPESFAAAVIPYGSRTY